MAQIVTKPGFARIKEDLGEKLDLTYWVCVPLLRMNHAFPMQWLGLVKLQFN